MYSRALRVGAVVASLLTGVHGGMRYMFYFDKSVNLRCAPGYDILYSIQL